MYYSLEFDGDYTSIVKTEKTLTCAYCGKKHRTFMPAQRCLIDYFAARLDQAQDCLEMARDAKESDFERLGEK